MPFSVKREEIIKRRSEFSGQLSTQCRALSAGILAFTWALMTAKDGPVKEPGNLVGSRATLNLGGIALLVILVLTADAVQYYAALRVENRCLEKMGSNDSAMYDQDLSYSVQRVAFGAKLVGLAIAVLWLLAFMGSYLL